MHCLLWFTADFGLCQSKHNCLPYNLWLKTQKTVMVEVIIICGEKKVHFYSEKKKMFLEMLYMLITKNRKEKNVVSLQSLAARY